MKKSFALILCLCFVFSLAGCKKTPKDEGSSVIYEYEYITKNGSGSSGSGSGSGGNGGTSGGNGGNGGNGGTSDGKVTVTNNCYSSGTKIAKDKITLKVLVRDYSGGTTNYNNCALTKHIESEMNIKLNFTTCTQSEVSTKMTLAYASGTNPYDIYMGMAPAASVHGSYIKQGKLKNLDSYIETYGTNIKKLYKEYPEAEYICTAEDGKKYMLPMINDVQNYSDLIYINKNWLSSIGKSLPTTTDDFKAVLTAFAQKYPGKTPFVATSDAGEDVGPAAFGPFGISTYHNWMYIDQSNDTIKYACTSDQYRTGLRYYNSLYSSGLLKFATDEDAVRKLTDSDSVGAVLCDSTEKAFNASVFNNSWTMVPVLNSSNGGTWANVKYENTWAEWFLVTDANKYPECSVRLADWFYSEEGTISALYGPRGTYWNYDNAGGIKLDTSKIPNGKSASEYVNTLTPGYCLPRLVDANYTNKAKTNTSENADTKMVATITNLKNTLIKPKAEQKYYFPHLNQTDSEAKQVADIGNYAQYVWQMRLSFINGTKSIDSDWDSFVNTMSSTYKIDTVTKVQNTAYKRYKAWLASK